MAKPTVTKFGAKAAAKTVKKPRPTRHENLLQQELQAHFVEVGITELEDIGDIWRALNSLMEILLKGNETQSIGHLLKLPVKKLGVIVGREFPDLVQARSRLCDLQALNSAGEGGAR